MSLTGWGGWRTLLPQREARLEFPSAQRILNNSRGCMSMKRICLLVLVALAGVLPAPSKDQPVATLTGMVTSDAEGHLGGVLVTARPEGANTTVTVISDDQGHYAFPPGKLQPGKYTLAIRAAGYELAGQAVAEIKPDKAAQVDIKLVKTKDLASQLTGAEWMMSIPGNEKQKKALFHCDQCHSLDLVAKSTYDAEGWLITLHRMQNQWQAGSTFTHPMPPAFPPKEYPSDPELAKYLSSINLSGDRTTWPYELKTFPRPRGADTKVVITEYEIPRAGSSPHDLAVDQDEMVWYSDFQAPNIGRLDPRTGQFKEWRLPRLKPGLPENNLTIELDKQGNPWLPRGYQGCAATMFDVKTEKFPTLFFTSASMRTSRRPKRPTRCMEALSPQMETRFIATSREARSPFLITRPGK